MQNTRLNVVNGGNSPSGFLTLCPPSLPLFFDPCVWELRSRMNVFFDRFICRKKYECNATYLLKIRFIGH